VIAFVLAATLWSNLASPVFVRVDVRDLPPTVEAVAQDEIGFMWIATQGGLARYDGYRFRVFAPNPSDPKALPDGYLLTLLADGPGLWIGTESSGLVRFDEASETFRTWRSVTAGTAGPRSATVLALAKGRNGMLWVGGDGGVDRFDPRTGTFSHVAFSGLRPQPRVRGIAIDRDGVVWAATSEGLFFGNARGFARFPIGAAPPAFSAAYIDAAGTLWLGSHNAVYLVDASRRHVERIDAASGDAALTPGWQRSFIEVKPGEMWIGSDSGISIVDSATRAIRRIAADRDSSGGLTEGQTVGFLRDRSGLIWIANAAGDLLWHNPNTTGIYELSKNRPGISLGDQDVISLAAFGGKLWQGGFKGAIMSLDPKSGTIARYQLPNQPIVLRLRPASDGTLWIGTLQGLCALRAHATAATCPAGPKIAANARITAIASSPRHLWLGTEAGIVEEDTASKAVRVFRHSASLDTLSNDRVTSLHFDRRGRLWAGTANGLDRIDPLTGRVVRYTFDPHDPDSVGPGTIETILEDRRGRIWAGAVGGPLNVLQERQNGTVTVKHLGRADGLPNENVDGLAQSPSGRIWASTDQRMAAIDPRTLRARTFGLADGTSDYGYWGGGFAQSEDGTMFFAGGDGVTVIAPRAASPWNYVPPVVLTALKAGGRDLGSYAANAGTTIDLAAQHHDFTAEFAALDYSGPQDLHYGYRLDGYDRDWIAADSEHRSATYTNLPPGSYTLEVRGTNRLGVWSGGSLLLHVRAIAAWYESWWFRLLVALLVLGTMLLALKRRTSVLERRQRELEATVRDRTAELSQANRALEEMSLTDPLTGLRNRRFLAQNIESEIALARRQPNDLVFFVIDVDHFKQVNDEHGHRAGDEVLVQVRERLEEVFRESDFLVRWGGEEFLAVTRGMRREDAGEMAQRVLRAIEDRAFTLGDGTQLRKTVSIGVAAYPLDPGKPEASTWWQVIECADAALYEAKEAGRNAWRLSSVLFVGLREE
jgi:diguanylate cyclase (GGDEF)-like protein